MEKQFHLKTAHRHVCPKLRIIRVNKTHWPDDWIINQIHSYAQKSFSHERLKLTKREAVKLVRNNSV